MVGPIGDHSLLGLVAVLGAARRGVLGLGRERCASELSNALIESTNTKIRLLTRIAFGFKNPKALIAPAMLALGGQRPTLPGRS